MSTENGLKCDVRVAPPNSLLLLMDSQAGEIPAAMAWAGLHCTPSCIAIGTLCSQDGPTHVVLTDAKPNSVGGLSRIYSGDLETPSRQLSLETVDGTQVWTADLDAIRWQLEVWSNHPREPDEILIVLQPGGQ